MCFTWLAESTGRKKDANIAHLRTIAQLCRAISSQLRYVSTAGKNMLNSNISTCPHNMVNFGSLTAEPTNGWDWLAGLGHPSKLQQGSHLCFVTAATSQKSTKLCTMFGRLLGWYTVYIFGGSCPLTEFCQVQNSLCVQVLRPPVLAALLHGTGAVAISHTLRHGTRNEIMELLFLIIFNRGRHLYSKGGDHVGHRPTF